MDINLNRLARQLWPYLQPLVEPMLRRTGTTGTGTGGGVVGGAPSPHALNSAHHTGTLGDAQAPQFLKTNGSRQLTGNLGVAPGVTIDGVDLSAHAANADAHHNQATAGDGIQLTGQQVAVDTTVVRTSRQVISGGGLTGGGDLSADRTLAVGAGTLITVAADSVGVTPGANYQFVGTGDGTAAGWRNVSELAGSGLTATDGVLAVNPGNGLEIASDAARVNQAYGFIWTAEHTFQADIQLGANLDFTGTARTVTSPANTNLTLAPGGDLVLDPGGSDVLPGGSIVDDLGDYNRKWRTLFAAELYVETLVAQDVMATIGGRVLVAPTTTLLADMTNAQTTIDVKHNNLTNGTYVYLATAPGGVAQIEVMKVTSGATTITGGYRYSVTRNLDGTGANTWAAGDAVASLGAAVGSGYIDLTSTSTIHSHLGPTIAIYSRSATTNWNSIKPVVALGNLESFVDYSGAQFGIAVGNDLTLTPATGFQGFTGDRSNGLRLFNVDLDLYSGATLAAKMDVTNGLSLLKDTGVYSNPERFVTWHDSLPAGTLRAMIGFYESSGVGRFRISGVGTTSGLQIELIDAGVDRYINVDAEWMNLAGDLYVGSGHAALVPTLKARDATGLSVEDDGANLGVFIKDGGDVGVGTSTTTSGYKLTVNGKVSATALNVGESDLTLFDDNGTPWTPTITGSVTPPTVDYTTQGSYYTRVNNTVFYHFTIVINTISGGSGNARFSLPFTAANDAGRRPIATAMTSGVAWPTGAQQVVFRPVANAAYGNLTGVQGNAAVTTVTIADLAAGDTISVSGLYYI